MLGLSKGSNGSVLLLIKCLPPLKKQGVFHVFLLEVYKKGGADVTIPPPALLPSGGIEYEVKKSSSHRIEDGINQFLICWKGDPQKT